MFKIINQAMKILNYNNEKKIEAIKQKINVY